MLSEGDPAPGFELRGVQDGTVETYRLGDYTDRGEWVLLAFYSFDFHPVCTEGMCALRDAEFFELQDDLAVLGASGDSVYAHGRFADQHDINFPLLADTGREVADRFGILEGDVEGMREVPRRAVFLVDSDETVRFAAAVDVGAPEEVDLGPVLDALDDIRG